MYVYEIFKRINWILFIPSHWEKKCLSQSIFTFLEKEFVHDRSDQRKHKNFLENMSCINEILTSCGTKKVFLAYERHELKVDVYSNACFQLDVDDRKTISQDMF